jgi:hypothetical protein
MEIWKYEVALRSSKSANGKKRKWTSRAQLCFCSSAVVAGESVKAVI